MDLHDASLYFDQDQLYDGYSGEALFACQTASYDDSSSDGATVRRRVMSFGPGLSLPARRVVTLYGERWLCGDPVTDGFQGEAIRQSTVMKRANVTMAILTPSQALSGAAGTSVYAQKVYFKDIANALTDAEYDTFWNVFVAPGEPAVKGSFLRDGDGILYRVRNTYVPTEGLRICQSDELDAGSRLTAIFDSGTYNPVTETRVAGTTAVNAIVVEMSKFFRFRHKSEQDSQAGDRMVVIPTSYTPKVGDRFTMNSEKWQVLSFQAELDAQALHVRRV